MKQNLTVNLQGLLVITIDSGLEITNRIDEFLRSFDSKEKSAYQRITIKKVQALPTSLHREYSDNIYINSESLIDLNYGIEVILKENEIILNTKYRYIEWLMYMIQIALLRTDSVLIHGAAVAKNGKAILFPSWGGVGKTAILNDFVKKYNYQVIGDDLFILTKNGKILSFPKPMVLYPYHKNLFPDLFKKSPTLLPDALNKTVSRLVPKIKKLLSPFPILMNFARNNNPQVKWALPTEVFGVENIANETDVERVYWLERFKGETVRNDCNDAIFSQILGSTVNEFDQRVVFCVNILMGLGVLDNKVYLIKWDQVLRNGLEKAKKGKINISSEVSIDEIGSLVHQML
ncbi:hypothetical protein MVI27_10020 [Chryseobacterium salipaludis]|uniref:hypothetical protein n=1 Tax=Chryseobacterium TaxID=59732 RepID=UPI001FF4A8C4|nr:MULTISPECIES: hypothetical protein [Chryseobacterium]MCJ8498595.1 hypothetical protein [Chryseobacterium salipaludis]MCX3297755.1 hypothetical protein [Planobacterium sp. JC490]